MSESDRFVIALTQGDPAGIGPEIVTRVAAAHRDERSHLLLFVERAALEALRGSVDDASLDSVRFVETAPALSDFEELEVGEILAVDPVGDARSIELGVSGRADAAGAMAAIDAAVAAVASGAADAIVTAPVSKASIAEHYAPSFRGHTEYLAEGAGLERYGRDYLMAFLAPGLQVALLSTHLPLVDAIAAITPERVFEALGCLDRHAGGRIAVAGINPHAGEAGLLGSEDDAVVRPGVERARASGIDAHGPESADSLFARARDGAFDWVLALYHDQGLIAVKTAAFGVSTNWTLGLPYLRTSVDHGTAFDIAGRGVADVGPLSECLATTVEILRGDLPKRRSVASALE